MTCIPCHYSCKTCSDITPNTCLSCFDNATKNEDGTCSCNEGFFNVDSIDPCVIRSTCSVGTPCDNSCKTCLSDSANSCLSCYDYSDFNKLNLNTNEGSCNC